jgi:hypothetical protein
LPNNNLTVVRKKVFIVVINDGHQNEKKAVDELIKELQKLAASQRYGLRKPFER